MGPLDVIRALVEAAGPDGQVTLPCRLIAPLLEGMPEERHPDVPVDLTCEQVAELLDRTPTCVRHWCRSGVLEGYRLQGREWRVPREALDAFQRRQRSAA